ncbi:MAG: hypothetical protein ACPL0C_03930 [Candidatus Bathyarchaeales archaeon]
MSKKTLSPEEIKFLQETCNADFKIANVRLREGEYQYNLAKTIASFMLEQHFPDVKDIIKRLYSEEKADDIRFVRKIQTILKKMEKSGLIRILPKEKPWDLQRYALLSFKFRDIDKNDVIFASDQQVRQVKGIIDYIQGENQKGKSKTGILVSLSAIICTSYFLSVWALMQPIINSLVFIPSFSIAVTFAVLLGKTLQNGDLTMDVK